MSPTTYEGGCHCWSVRFSVRVTGRKAIRCNCSICELKGFLHVIVPQEDFTLLCGELVLTEYTFNTHQAKHRFCSRCGIHAFYRPRSHPDCISVNLKCLDGDVASEFEIEPFDGRNWEANIGNLK